MMTNRASDDQSRARFWRSVTEAPGGCWVRTKGLGDHGYSRFGDRSMPWTHGELYAHRIIWRAARGGDPIPAGHDIDHICRTRACVNPWHLRSIPSSFNRGDSTYTNRHGRAIFTDDQAAEIRCLAAAGLSCQEIAERFGTYRQLIRNIVAGYSYRPLPDERHPMPQRRKVAVMADDTEASAS